VYAHRLFSVYQSPPERTLRLVTHDNDLGFFPLQLMLQVLPVTSPAAPKNWSFMTGH